MMDRDSRLSTHRTPRTPTTDSTHLATAAAPTETTTQNHHAHAANRGEQRLQGRDDDRLEAIRTSEDPRERMIREGPVAPMEDHAAPLAQTTLEEEEEAL